MFAKVNKTLPKHVLRSGDPGSISPWILKECPHSVLDVLSKKLACEQYKHAKTPGATRARRDKIEPQVLRDRTIVFCTLGSLLGLRSMRSQNYAHTVIDEAAQSAEADFASAASQSQSMSLVGDPCQLPPGYAHPLMRLSIMGRLLRNAGFPVVILDIQYGGVAESCSEDHPFAFRFLG